MRVHNTRVGGNIYLFTTYKHTHTHARTCPSRPAVRQPNNVHNHVAGKTRRSWNDISHATSCEPNCGSVVLYYLTGRKVHMVHPSLNRVNVSRRKNSRGNEKHTIIFFFLVFSFLGWQSLSTYELIQQKIISLIKARLHLWAGSPSLLLFW